MRPAPRWFIDATPLFVPRFTGIPSVACQLTEWFYQHEADRSFFFRDDRLLQRAVIGEVVALRRGWELERLHTLGVIYAGTVGAALAAGAGPTVGIYPQFRPAPRRFDYEAQVIYDLSTVVHPEFHVPRTIRETAAMIDTVPTAELGVCISEATRREVVDRVGLPREKTIVAHPGTESEPAADQLATDLLDQRAPEPYVLVLGTIEPRKNLPLLLTHLARNPELLARCRVVFAGPEGWGPSLVELVAAAGLGDALARGRLLATGFVSDREKQVLLRGAQFLVFPSWYEGFGLPVGEALAAGCPVLASDRASIPEVGGEAAFYFDPASVESLARGWAELTRQLARDREGVVRRGRVQAARFTADSFGRTIRDRIVGDLERRAR